MPWRTKETILRLEAPRKNGNITVSCFLFCIPLSLWKIKKNGKSWSSEAQDEKRLPELLPGILDDITLHQIVPKLPWTAFHALSSVSPSWRKAIQSRQVFNLRASLHSTETLAMMNDKFGRIFPLNMSTHRWYKLPPIPAGRGVLKSMVVASADGKIYAFPKWRGDRHDQTVHVFDPIGQKGWKECAKMLDQREHFRCGVRDGKIYVFSGLHYKSRVGSVVQGSEVYNPTEDAWTRIAPMPTPRSYYKTITLGEEIVVRGGFSQGRRLSMEPPLEAYDPVKDAWREVMAYSGRHYQTFSANGKLYSITLEGIEAYNDKENTWRHLHSNVFPDNGRRCSLLLDIMAVNDELFSVWSGVVHFRASRWPARKLCHSVGFRSGREDLLWVQVAESRNDLRMQCSLQL